MNYASAGYVGLEITGGGLSAALFGDCVSILEAVAIVVAASRIAPDGRVIVATLTAALQTSFWGVLPILEISMNRILLDTNWRPGALWVLIGSVIGVAYVRKREKKKAQERDLTKLDAGRTPSAETSQSRREGMVAAGLGPLEAVVGQRVRSMMLLEGSGTSGSRIVFFLGNGEHVSLVVQGRCWASEELRGAGPLRGEFEEDEAEREAIRSTLHRLWSRAPRDETYEKADWSKLACELGF